MKDDIFTQIRDLPTQFCESLLIILFGIQFLSLAQCLTETNPEVPRKIKKLSLYCTQHINVSRELSSNNFNNVSSIQFKFLFYTDTTCFLAMQRRVKKRDEKAQLYSFAVVDAPKARTAYALYLRDQYAQYNSAGLTNQQRISLISRSWKVLVPDVKDKYYEMAREEKRRQQTHIDTKINELSTPLLPSRLPKVSVNTSAVAMIVDFVLEQGCQIGVLMASHHKCYNGRHGSN